jgi:type IV pilus assembly protein PilC
LSYLIALGVAATIVITFICYWIVPKFRKIFEDFETELPDATKLMLWIVDWAINYFYVIFLGLLAAWFIFYLVRSANRPDANGPFWNGLWFPSRWIPDIERSLSVVVEEGRPIASALASLSAHHPSRAIRALLSRLHSEVNAGNPLWGMLAERGLIRRADASVLVAAERVGNLPWALRSVADNTERRSEFRSRVVIELLQPMAIALVGIVIGGFVFAMFLPLIKIVRELS